MRRSDAPSQRHSRVLPAPPARTRLAPIAPARQSHYHCPWNRTASPGPIVYVRGAAPRADSFDAPLRGAAKQDARVDGAEPADAAAAARADPELPPIPDGPEAHTTGTRGGPAAGSSALRG